MFHPCFGTRIGRLISLVAFIGVGEVARYVGYLPGRCLEPFNVNMHFLRQCVGRWWRISIRVSLRTVFWNMGAPVGLLNWFRVSFGVGFKIVLAFRPEIDQVYFVVPNCRVLSVEYFGVIDDVWFNLCHYANFTSDAVLFYNGAFVPP